MTDNTASIAPTEINLHRKSRLLEISFSDGFRFSYPCEYLRVFSAHGREGYEPVHGKERVEIEHIEPQGTDALELRFNDGHTANYSWPRLHELGLNYEQNWQSYEQQLREHNISRSPARGEGRVRIRLLYFIQLARIAGKDGETVEIPPDVSDVESLLDWLRRRGPEWEEAFADDKVQVTVNKQFAEPFTLIEQGDEVAIVPQTR
jgi:DUF971 family protein/molybdopterin converting factor small subunit